jgi:hypothetical protein
VPRERLAQLATYQQSASAIVGQSSVEHEKHAQWARWYKPDGTTRMGYGPVIVAVIVMIGGMSMAGPLVHYGIVDDAHVGWLVAPFAFLPMVGLFAWSMILAARARTATPPPARVGATCPSCGAPASFAAGRIAERCVHCGAALVTSAALMGQALDAARSELRRTAMDRLRLERRAMAGVYATSASTVLPYFVMGPFLFMLLFAAVAFTVGVVTGSDDSPIGALLLLWALVFAGGGAMYLVFALRRRRRLRWRAIAEAVVASLGGRVEDSATGWVAWLNTFWAGPYDVARLLVGPGFHAATGWLDGHPIAVDVDPIPASSEYGKARAEVLLAAQLPGDGVGEPNLAVPLDLARRAQAVGFTLAASSGGLTATFDGPVDGLGRGGPVAASGQVLTAARLLVEWAARLGAANVSPMG